MLKAEICQIIQKIMYKMQFAPSCCGMGIFILGLKRKAHHSRGTTLIKNKNTLNTKYKQKVNSSLLKSKKVLYNI